MSACKPHPSDVSDEEWALVAPCLALLPEGAGQRHHSLREAFKALRYLVRSGRRRSHRAGPSVGGVSTQ